MESIITQLSKKYYLSLDASKKFAEIITIEDIKNGNVFVERGRANKKEYLLFDGICRSSIISSKGDDITLDFFTPNSAIPPNLTRTNSNKSIFNIQALSDSILASFSGEDLMTLMNENREIEVWANGILQAVLLQRISKEVNQIAMSATERLVEFRAKYPHLENRIPHSYISSYLGITKVSLSRIRKELATQQS